MTSLAAPLRDVVEALAGQGAPFALVGGLAVSARTEPRFTRDIDLVVAVENDREAEAVVRALAPSYEVLVTLEHDALQRLAAVRVGRRALPPPRRWSTCCSRPRG